MELLVLDTETTGLNIIQDYYLERGYKQNQILGIAACKVNLIHKTYEIVYDSYCKPPEWDAEMLAATWIITEGYVSLKDVLNAPSLEKVAEEFRSKMPQLPWTSFNNSFDGKFLERDPWKLPPAALPCIMQAATEPCDLPYYSEEGEFLYIKFPKLEEAYEILVKNPPRLRLPSHGALSDSIKACEVLLALYEAGQYHIPEVNNQSIPKNSMEV